MSRISFFIPLLIVLLAACSGNDQSTLDSKGTIATEKQYTTIEWIDSSRNYGNINEGQKLAISFRFKNSGTKPLIIESVQPACGCTVADYPKKPLAPGEEGEITGEFDSKDREGLQHKDLTVTSNTTPAVHSVSFDVNVIKKQ